MKAAEDIIARIDYGKMKPFTAMLPVLDELKKNNILIVISSNDSPTIQEALRLYNFNGIFQEILGSDFKFSKKEKILYAIKKYSTAPDDIYYIGDTAGDIKEGKQAGVKTVGVTWGWHSKEKMAASKPDYLFDSPQELLLLR
jgi:phosphoglycolate phosphatase